MSRTTTAADRRHMGRVAALGCVICGSPAEVHHITGAGMALRAKHTETIPLCPLHHRTGGIGVAVHAGTKTWEAVHGTQRELLARVNERLELPV